MGETLRSGGQILVDQLVAQGVERVYCVPGESYLAALDAMNNAPIELTVCRQEAGAAMMALTEGRLTGRPGICFVTRGPGATNAAHGAAYRRARFRADDPVHRPGRAGDDGAGRLPGDGLSGFVRLDHEARDADRDRGANPRNCPARVSHRDAGPAGPGGDRAARGHADGNGGRARRAARRAGPDLAGPHANGRIAEDAMGGRAADRHSRRRRMDASGRAPPSPASPSASICRSPARFGARARSTASTTISPAKSASPSIPS